MPLFMTEEEYERCSTDVSVVADKADAFIKQLHNQLETVKAQSDAASITAEQTCSLLEQRFVSLSTEFANLQSQNSQLTWSLDNRLSELAQLQADKHQIQLQSIYKDGEIERLSVEASELHKSKRQLIELLEQKDLEISEKNSTSKGYLDKIVNLTEDGALREARLNDIEADMARTNASCARLIQEKELIERHNVWLNDELTAKVNSLIELRRTHSELEADMSAKLEDAEKKYKEVSTSLKWKNDRIKELELKIDSVQQELCSSKDAAAAAEGRFSAELSTVNKLVELYKESSEEWSKKAGEMEGVIRALETHSLQVQNDYKERLEKEESARKEYEKEASSLKQKLEKCEAELESTRNANELSLIPMSLPISKPWIDPVEENEMACVPVPSIPAGVSGTALAASLLRDGWSLAKMYAKYHEAVDALRHEQLGRKQSQAILERVLYEIEDKAALILDERAEHDRLVEAYSAVNEKLQNSLSEQRELVRNIQELKVELRKHEKISSSSQKEIIDLEKQVTVLLKECRDIQLRCGYAEHYSASEEMSVSAAQISAEPDTDKLTFRDINGLVEQNVHLRSLVHDLSDQLDNRDLEHKVKLEEELKKLSEEAASKVNAVLARAEEQGCMLESLHTSVAMYKKLYEEEHKLRSSSPSFQEAAPDESRSPMVVFEGSQETAKKAQEQAFARVKCLEEQLLNMRSEITSLRSERDKFALEANFAQEKFDRLIKEFEHQRDETNGVITRNVEFSQLIIDYQRKIREFSESTNAAQELMRKSTMEVNILKHEKEMLVNAEKRACEEVRSLSERIHRLQASLDTIQSTEEVREEVRSREFKTKEEYFKKIEREWAEAKKELQEERNNVRTLTLERENTLKSAMRQVEEMGKELANTLHTVTAAETRASAAEARCSDMEKKIRSWETKVSRKDEHSGLSSTPTDEAVVDAREEIEKLREEARVNREHMLQYKSIAEVNEVALKQIEEAHENFKSEADRVKKSLEAEIMALSERVDELGRDCSSKSKEAATAAAGQEEAVSASLSEISSLKDMLSVKTSQIVLLETQISAMKDDLEKEHQRWRAAQANYERQVILQSETIQELTKTSEVLSSLQGEASELRKLTEQLKTENNELKVNWEMEKSTFDKEKSETEKKYNEINEQNKILHSRLEALHIKLAETERTSGKPASETIDDSGLQNVVNYLRRSKEIAETEISLLKQEKLRLQSQLESALKAAEISQASLRNERANSRSSMFTEEEFKSLQLQAREMSLLRESNIQLREENKYNVNECQRLREVAQNAKMETEKLENFLAEKQAEVDACKKELDDQKMKIEFLEKRVGELVERGKNIDVEEYDRMVKEFHQMQVNMREKDAQVDEIKKLVAEKDEVLLSLEQDLASCRRELNERDSRINNIMQLEKSEVDKQKRFIMQYKRKYDVLVKEKDDLSKENQAHLKQLDEYRQGKRSSTEAALGEQTIREKDTRIQMLEKTVERLREELKTEKSSEKVREEQLKSERSRRAKIQKTIAGSYETVTQEKTKILDELEKHKQGLKTLIDEVEKLKDSKSSQPEGVSSSSVSELLNDLGGAYLVAVDSFERVAQPIIAEPAGSPSSALDASAATESGVPALVPPSAVLVEEKERGKGKTGRRLIRPRIARPPSHVVDTEMSDVVEPTKTVPPTTTTTTTTTLNNVESEGVQTAASASGRKRLQSESQEEFEVDASSAAAAVAPPVLKKSKQEEEVPEVIVSASEEAVLDQEGVECEEDEDEEEEMQNVDEDRQNNNNNNINNVEVSSKSEAEQVMMSEGGVSENEEGELVPDDAQEEAAAAAGGGIEEEEEEEEEDAPPEVVETAEEGGEGDVKEDVDGGEDDELVNEGDDIQVAVVLETTATPTDEVVLQSDAPPPPPPEAASGSSISDILTPPPPAPPAAAASSISDVLTPPAPAAAPPAATSTSTSIETTAAAAAAATAEVVETRPARKSTTINLIERAKQRAAIRQTIAPTPPSSASPARGRGRPPGRTFDRGTRGRGPRPQPPAQ
jgi:nucleoprotein TPR